MQVRPERLIEKRGSSGVKQRQVNVLTKSSLGLPINRTVVYIHRDLRDHVRNVESYRMMKNRIKRIEWNRKDHELRQNVIERGRRDE